MTKSDKQINKEAGMSDVDSSPAVVAYRVAQLERTVKEGFDRQTEQLTRIVNGFVTEKEYAEAKLESKTEHDRLQKQIDAINKNAKWWLTFIILGIGAAASIILAIKK